MQVLLSLVVALLHLATLGHAAYTPRSNRTSTITPELMYQFPLPSWIENLAIRKNGNLLLTLLSNPAIYSVNPKTKESHVLTTITEKTSLFAIAELDDDEFYVSAGNFSMMTATLEPGSFALYRVAITSSKKVEGYEGNEQEKIEVSKVVDLPDAMLVNGMATLRKSRKVLVPDSYKGVIFVVDAEKKTIDSVIDLPEFHGPPGKVGLNGIKIHDGDLYFTVSTPPSLFRVKFDEKKAVIKQGAEVIKIASDAVFMDDFAVDGKHRAWITTNAGNVVVAVDADGKKEKETVVVAGKKGALDIAGPTACAFGRGKGQEDILYVVTTGGLGGGVDGGAKEGGKVVALDTRGYKL